MSQARNVFRKYEETLVYEKFKNISSDHFNK